ncbi:PREDICTED: protein KRI1 homolog [Dinoponera quadriceps]|uniref:Protein KRI1 homolog n=1 Tax=Dinoponera quadriceps TaxID=609295 RepID=A0A6P3YDT8_DINQU|nr:PREDICTED: protein KRI1 homolog [Dinoponera quadriceps]
MSTLFNGDNSDSDGEIKINTDYAKNYDNWRQKEELNKLKTKYEEVITDDSGSSDDEDDENIEDPQFDREFYKTLACLKKKNPCIYDEGVKFFNNIDISGTAEYESENKRKDKLKKEKAVFLRDYERKIVMEGNGQFSSSEDEDNKQNAKIKIHTYIEEQQEMKDGFKHVLKEESDTDEDTGFLKVKQKTEDDKQKEEESYKKWLKGGNLEIDSQEQEELKPLRDFWTNPNLDENEKFLRDYILNNKYIDKESSDVELDYDQIAHDSDQNLSEDEKNIEKQEEFEHKYNFRFEEPDQEFIKRYPRTMENSMRRKDTRRSQKRAEVRQRKEQEKQQKKEELKQLKALKRKEIEEKIDKLKEITGNNDMHFDNVDFDADFDPNEHDRKMKELFDEEYYAGVEDDVKPEFPDIDEELGIESTWDDYDPKANEIDIDDASHGEPHCEDPEFNMDADYDGNQNLHSELVESTRKSKRKRRSKFATLIATEKPKFDPKQFPSYEEYFDQYYSLNYEDMIGDLPCRFKYRKVMPNDYGLSVEEILMADDKELNKWSSLKRALQHKSEHAEMQEVRVYKQKSSNEMLKRKILKSLYTESEKQEDGNANADEQTTTGDNIDSKKRRRKKTKNSNFNADSTNANTAEEGAAKASEDNTQNNARNIKNDADQDENTREKNVANKSNKWKRKEKLNVDSDSPRPKKVKVDNIKKGSSWVQMDNKIEKGNVETASVDKTALARKKRDRSNKRKLQFNKVKSGKCRLNSDSTDLMMSLNAERLKSYGINAKKFKNKLKYGKRKL